MKFDFRSEFQSFERKSTSTNFVYNFIIRCSKKNKENYPEGALEQRNIETWIKI